MTDYTQITNFTAKDALPSSDPAKLIRGSLFDAEFAALVAAVATKSNKASNLSDLSNAATARNNLGVYSAYKAADTDRASTTTYADDADMVLTSVPSGTYHIDI